MTTPLLSLSFVILFVLMCWFLLRPDQGVWWRWQRARQLTQRVLREDALKYIHKRTIEGRPTSLEGVAGALHIDLDSASVLIAELEAEELTTRDGNRLDVTAAGRDAALQIIRVHRLWERYLAEETGYAQHEWHERAERREHMLTPAEADALSARLNYPTHDPHGDPIPTAEGDMMVQDSIPLTKLERGAAGRVVHVEDEPATVYAQLVAEGINVGMVVRVTEQSAERIRCWTNGDEHLLAPVVANNISVYPLPEPDERLHQPTRHLSDLVAGEAATVARLSPACRGMERRRFMDLGILPGTEISAEFVSPGGDPTAYLVRGTLIALRREQADLIELQAEAAQG
jgi:DtxR family Mn-dependent transcriptional regulator